MSKKPKKEKTVEEQTAEEVKEFDGVKKEETQEAPAPAVVNEGVPEPVKFTESNAVRMFREKCDIALSKVKTVQQFRDSDKIVDFVFETGHNLFNRPLDQYTPDLLIRIGGKLVGSYSWLGQMSARARAERDVYEQKCDEVEKELVLEFVRGKAYKVTEAKARASAEMEELREQVIQKDVAKNQWESVTEACQTMTMFIQSAIRVKEGEKFAGKKLHDN